MAYNSDTEVPVSQHNMESAASIDNVDVEIPESCERAYVVPVRETTYKVSRFRKPILERT